MSGRKCNNCGSSEIEEDPARGDAVCTNCGSVLEEGIIVSEVQFEEGAHGTSNAIGTFVSADSKGCTAKLGASFRFGIGVESREITLKKARRGITQLCQLLQLNQHCIDTACNFFKCALARNVTKGRKNTHVYAACVYLTCRTERTPHLLIDISDVMQICCYELGRTYLRISQALLIKVPVVDPCIYILRFAAQLEFDSETQKVAKTALHIVQRMKRDSIHSGRKPAGLCGAALYMASRSHGYNRTVSDIVKIVHVHESTLRKRLEEFSDTPSSALTLDEFMTIDLEEEQDPPAFKAARKEDKERAQRLIDTEANQFTEIQKAIEEQLEKKRKKSSKRKYGLSQEKFEIETFIEESTAETIKEIIHSESVDDPTNETEPRGLGPNFASMGLANSIDDTSNSSVSRSVNKIFDETDFSLDDIDDKELDAYILTEEEYDTKNKIWLKRNAVYLEEQRVKEEERQKKEQEEGKPEKKRRKVVRRKPMGPANSASEAIEKIVQEKKLSKKINYEVLKSLINPTREPDISIRKDKVPVDTTEALNKRLLSSSNIVDQSSSKLKKLTKQFANSSAKPNHNVLPLAETPKAEEKTENALTIDHTSEEEEFDEDDYVEEQAGMGVSDMLLLQHNNVESAVRDIDDYDDYDDDAWC